MRRGWRLRSGGPWVALPSTITSTHPCIARCPCRFSSRWWLDTPSRRILPWPAQAHRGDDQPDMRIGLRKVAPGLAVVERQVLRQQSQRIALGEHAFEQCARLVLASDRGERIDVPECTDRETGLRHAEIVRRDVSAPDTTAQQVAV